jgi:hypothetical protein
VEWEILMTTQVEGFLNDLYDADRYRTAIPQAEQLYADYLAEREKETGR